MGKTMWNPIQLKFTTCQRCAENNTLKILGSRAWRLSMRFANSFYCHSNWELPYLLLLFKKPIECLEKNNLPKCSRKQKNSLWFLIKSWEMMSEFEITFNKYLFCVWHPETIGRNSIILGLKEGFPGRSDGQDPPAMRDTGFDPWVGKIPWRREGLPTPVFWPGEFQGLYSPWDRKESDMTERLSLTFT